MLEQEARHKFITMRAEGHSYDKIAKTLGISKSTCVLWSRSYAEEIGTARQESLRELLETYHATKAERIKSLGKTLGAIEGALDRVDLSRVDPDKLLNYKLKYLEMLKGENISLDSLTGEVTDARSIVDALSDLYSRVRADEVTGDQASREVAVLVNMLKAFDVAEVKDAVDKIDSILERRTG